MKRLVMALLFAPIVLASPARAEDPIGCALTSAPLMAQPEGSAEYAKGIATPLTMVGWQIEGNQIRRAAPKALENLAGVAIIVRNIASAPPKALQLKKALAAGSIGAQLVADASVPEGGAMIWIGRRPVFMQA